MKTGWHAVLQSAPGLFVASAIGFVWLFHFGEFNFQALGAGFFAGVSIALGHFAVAKRHHRVQVLSLALLVVSALLVPSAPRPLQGLMMLNGFIAGMGFQLSFCSFLGG